MDDTRPPDPDDDDLAALDFSAPDTASMASDLDALGGYGVDEHHPQNEEPSTPTFTVTNPPGTVTVSALMDGRVHRIDLSQKVITMTETGLADEIVVIAQLATQEARAAQYVDMLDGMRQQGHDEATTRDFLTRDLELPSPADASAARAQVFTTRYVGEE